MKLKLKPSKSKITLLLITLIGLIFRLISLTQGIELQYKLDTSVFPDEAGFLIYAKYILNWDVGSISTSYHGSIIFSGIIAIFYSVFGVYAIIGRLISIVFETFTIVIVYFFAKEIFVSEKKALLSSFLVAISSIMRFWDMRALSDGPLTFFFTLSLYLFFKGVKKEKIKYFILAGISSTVTFLVKFPGILTFFIFFIYFMILIVKPETRYKKKRIFISFLIILILFMFTIFLILLSQLVIIYQPFIEIGEYLMVLFQQPTNLLYYIFYLLSLDTIYGIIILIFLIIIALYSIIKINNETLLLIIWCVVFFIFFSFYGGSELYRYLLPAFPALYMLISNFFIDIIVNNLKIFKFPHHIVKKIIVVLCIISLFFYTGLEVVFGEYITIKRANTYKGIYNSSIWLLKNAPDTTNVMAPMNSLSQLEFYTSDNYKYYPLSTENDWTSIVNDLRNKDIDYVIISTLQYPETQNLPICILIHSYLTPIYNSTDGIFITYIYNTSGL